MVNNLVWEICEHVAEVQVLLDDHLAGGKHSAVDVVARAQAVLTEAAATGDVRCRLLPAEHAAVARNSGEPLTATVVFWGTRCRFPY